MDCYDSVVVDSAGGFVDLAGAVTIGVTSPADLSGGVTVRVTSLADAGVASPANLAGGVTVGLTSLAVAGVASLAVAGVASLADFAEVASSADMAGNVTLGVTFLADPVDIVTGDMTFRDKCGALDGSACDCDDYCDGSPGYGMMTNRVIVVVALM